MTSPKSKPANRPRAFKSNRPPAPSKSKRSGSPKSNRPKSNRPESPKVKIIHLPPRIVGRHLQQNTECQRPSCTCINQ